MGKIILFNRLEKFNPSVMKELSDYIPLNKGAGTVLKQSKDPVHVIHALLEGKFYYESVHLLALGLPKREAVWWSYLAALKAEGEEPPEKILTVLTLVRHWVYKPNDEARYQAKSISDGLDPDSAARWAVLATFWSGDNIGPKNKPPVKPSAFMANMASAKAVVIAGEQGEARDLNFLTLILQGAHIANGGNGQLNEAQQASVLAYLKG